jgi:hypothetical protein
VTINSNTPELGPPQPITKRPTEAPPFSWRSMAVVCGVLGLLYAIPLFLDLRGSGFKLESLIFAAAGGLSGVIYYGIYYLIKRWIWGQVAKQQFETSLIQKSTEKLQDDLDKDFFTNLVKINFKYLDKYYLQTQLQAEKSFLLAAVAALVGLSIVVCGIVLMYMDKMNPAYLASGAGTLTELIAAIFFYLYNRTVLKMSEYHQKLVFTQNIALALRISEGLPKTDKVHSQLKLIASLTEGINEYLVGRIQDVEQKGVGSERKKADYGNARVQNALTEPTAAGRI